MKGIVFTEFLDMVADRFSPEVADSIVEQSELESGGAYTSLGTYPFTEMAQLVTRLSEQTKIPLPDLLRTFGFHLFPRFAALYPQFFTEGTSCFDFLQSVEHYIHIEVRKLYPDAELPTFEYDTSVAGRLEMVYRSTRPLGELAHGLLTGCIHHFRAPIDVKMENVETEQNAVRFILTEDAERGPLQIEDGGATEKASTSATEAADVEITDLPAALVEIERLKRNLERERRARRNSEAIAEEKTRDLYHANSELQSTLGYLRTIIDTMVDGLLVIDTEGTIKLVSQSSLVLLNIDGVERMLEHKSAEVLPASLNELIDKCVANQESDRARVTPDGASRRVLDAVASPIEADGKPIGMVVIVRDISAEVTIAKQRSMTDMVAGVAHELNTPLSVVDMAARIITDSLTSDELARLAKKNEDVEELVDDLIDSCKLITQNTKRVAKLIESFKKLSVNLLSHERERVDLSEFVEIVVKPLEMETKKLAVEIIDEVPEDKREWVGYPSHLVQVLTYVFMNIVEYAYPGESSCKSQLHLSLSPDGKDYHLVIRDFGVGIPPENLTQVFDAFFTTNRGSSNGLGLAIAHNIIVDGWRGAMSAESTVGEGTTIRISFARELS